MDYLTHVKETIQELVQYNPSKRFKITPEGIIESQYIYDQLSFIVRVFPNKSRIFLNDNGVISTLNNLDMPARLSQTIERVKQIKENDGKYKSVLHCNTFPALTYYSDLEKTDKIYAAWYKDGLMHRDIGPALDSVEALCYFKEGVLHRDAGPAIQNHYFNLTAWYNHGKLHREDGPAIETPDLKVWAKGNIIQKVEYKKKNYNCINGIYVTKAIKALEKRKDFVQFAAKMLEKFPNDNTINFEIPGILVILSTSYSLEIITHAEFKSDTASLLTSTKINPVNCVETKYINSIIESSTNKLRKINSKYINGKLSKVISLQSYEEYIDGIIIKSSDADYNIEYNEGTPVNIKAKYSPYHKVVNNDGVVNIITAMGDDKEIYSYEELMLLQ